MNTEYRYILEKNSKKHQCPNCNKRRFVRYVDKVTSAYLPSHYGRCDRESKCSYYLDPYKDSFANSVKKQEQGKQINWQRDRQKQIKKPQKKTAFIPPDILEQTLQGYEKNIFIQNLIKQLSFPFSVEDIEKIISLYYLGTVQNGYRTGANTFPFIDAKGNIRAIQVKQFDEQNHTTGTDFLHSIIEKHHTRNNKPLPEWLEAYNKNQTKVSCLFGEHLLSKYLHNPVALVEAPKTAIYGTLYFGFPEQPTNLLWMAVYNLSSLNFNKCQALKGRNVYLFPDLSKEGKAFQLWSNKANEIQKRLRGTYFHVSDLLEQLAPEQDKEQGKDIADYLIKQDWRLFRKADFKEASEPKPTKSIATTICKKGEKGEKSEVLKNTFFSQPEPLNKVEVFIPEPLEQSIKEQPENWGNDIAELETYFASIELPTQSLKLNRCSTIKDCSIFIESHFATVKTNNGKRTFLPYLNRLQELKQILTINSN